MFEKPVFAAGGHEVRAVGEIDDAEFLGDAMQDLDGIDHGCAAAEQDTEETGIDDGVVQIDNDKFGGFFPGGNHERGRGNLQQLGVGVLGQIDDFYGKDIVAHGGRCPGDYGEAILIGFGLFDKYVVQVKADGYVGDVFDDFGSVQAGGQVDGLVGVGQGVESVKDGVI